MQVGGKETFSTCAVTRQPIGEKGSHSFPVGLSLNLPHDNAGTVAPVSARDTAVKNRLQENNMVGALVLVFFSICGDVLKRFGVFGLLAAVVIGIIAAVTGGSFLWAAGISVVIGLVVTAIVGLSAIFGRWG